jgi:hypothetical protein
MKLKDSDNTEEAGSCQTGQCYSAAEALSAW